MEEQELLRQSIFADDGENAYAIIDGAACEELLEQLAQLEPENCCLYAGELEPDMQACAPYLIVLSSGHPFTEWLIENLPGKPWGIFVRSPASLRQLRKHFRTFLIVKNEHGENLYFRYYDPRVIRTFLPTCDDEQFQQFFGPVSSYVGECDKEGFASYSYASGKLQTRRLATGTVPGSQPV